MIQPPTRQIPGVYHRRIGDIVVTALSDGYLDGTVDVLQNIASDEAMRMLTETFRPGRRTSVNCYAIHSAGRLALIETGSGDYLLPTAGKLQANLAAAGIDPADVEKVILTHMHPDHSAGLTDPKTGSKMFLNGNWWCTRTSRGTGTTMRPWRRRTSGRGSCISNARASRWRRITT
jgi:glyoxylase-like metal-dependent hydrolase (beta-lactamase superfamily II)